MRVFRIVVFSLATLAVIVGVAGKIRSSDPIGPGGNPPPPPLTSPS